MSSARIPRFLMVCCVAALAVALSWSPAPARVVEVPWTPGDESDGPHTREQAREVAFRNAVLGEALDLLPGALSVPRQELLRLYLLPRAADYVQSYAEAGSAQAGPEASMAAPGSATVLRLDVMVNRPALRRALQRMGVYYTVRGTREYDLALAGAAGGALEDVARLQELSGLNTTD